MFCPRCGYEQPAPETRYCPRCGFALSVVARLVAGDGLLPELTVEAKPMSPCRRGVRQGFLLIFVGTVLLPLLAVLDAPKGVAVTAALLTFLVGFLRILYSAIFLSRTPQQLAPSLNDDSFLSSARLNASTATTVLPPSPAARVTLFDKRTTGELVRPSSVTEGTTRLLDKS